MNREKLDGNVHSGHRARVKSRFIEHGAEHMDDCMLLEMLLFYGLPRRDTNPVAHKLIERYGSLAAVLRADVNDLKNEPDLGESSAVLLSLVSVLANRMRISGIKKISLSAPSQALEYCVSLISNKKNETVYALSVDKSMNLLSSELVNKGTLCSASVPPRTVVSSALRHNAYGVILTHNHPSGDIRPSSDDISVTRAVSAALCAIDIRLFDHVIVGTDKAFSMCKGIILGAAEQISDVAAVSGTECFREQEYLRQVAEATEGLFCGEYIYADKQL